MPSKKYNYFESFNTMVGYACKAAGKLHTLINSFDMKEIEHSMTELHEIEHSADVEKHEMMKHLAKEFITPIEREDIMALAQEIDEVTDCIEDVLLKSYMFNITSMKREAVEFTNVIVSCCEALKNAVNDFQNFKRSETIDKNIIEVNRLEEVGDRLYTKAMRTLYSTCDNPIEVLGWTEMFRCFEKCCDACEHVANVIEEVIMKNS